MDAAMHQQGSRDTSREYRTTDANWRTLVRCRCQRPKNELDHSRTIAETASFLCRDVYEVRAKMKELRLTEQPSKRRVGFYNNRTPYSPAR